jgi:hypothetical protein
MNEWICLLSCNTVSAGFTTTLFNGRPPWLRRLSCLSPAHNLLLSVSLSPCHLVSSPTFRTDRQTVRDTTKNAEQITASREIRVTSPSPPLVGRRMRMWIGDGNFKANGKMAFLASTANKALAFFFLVYLGFLIDLPDCCALLGCWPCFACR